MTPDSQLQVVSKGLEGNSLDPPDWTAATWIEQQYHHDRTHLLRAVQFFSTARTVTELTTFLAAIPQESRWIHPLLPFFTSHRNKKAVLFLLLCPKRNQSIEMTPVDKYLFTAHLVRPIGDLIARTTGKPVIYANFRKQCRRDKKYGNCLTITQLEVTLFNIATRVELLLRRQKITLLQEETLCMQFQSKLAKHPKLVQLPSLFRLTYQLVYLQLNLCGKPTPAISRTVRLGWTPVVCKPLVQQVRCLIRSSLPRQMMCISWFLCDNLWVAEMKSARSKPSPRTKEEVAGSTVRGTKEEERAKRRARNKRNHDSRNEQQKARQTSHRKKYRDRLRAEGKAVK